MNPTFPPQQQPPMAPQQAAPQQAPAMPAFHGADEAAMTAQLQQDSANAESGGGFGPKAEYVRWPSPTGNGYDWRGVGKGQESYVDLYLCGTWDRTIKVPYVESVTHWVRVGGKVFVINCPNVDDQCLFCTARGKELDRGNDSASNWGKKRYQKLYNVFNISDPTVHMGDDGIMRPLVLAAGNKLQGKLKSLFETRNGYNAFADPQAGRPIRAIKRKTGPEDQNVEYDAIDLDPTPLDQYFYAGYQNLWDLSKLIEKPNDKYVLECISALGWQSPVGMTQQAAYSPQAMPPQANPYPQQPQMAAPPPMPAPMPQQQMAPQYPQPANGGFQQQQMQPPPQMPAPAPMPPAAPMQQQMQPPPAAPQPMAPPAPPAPPMSAPPPMPGGQGPGNPNAPF